MFNFLKKKKCSCYNLPDNPTSMESEKRYQSMLKCPIHKHVPDDETKRYETKYKVKVLVPENKGFIKMHGYAVMQAVCLGKDGNLGIKMLTMPSGYRVFATFHSKDDARAYLLDVLDTVKREQEMGLRTARNLDPSFDGGLDFYISPMWILVPKGPMRERGWEIPKLSTGRGIAKRHKLTHTIKEKKGRKEIVRK